MGPMIIIYQFWALKSLIIIAFSSLSRAFFRTLRHFFEPSPFPPTASRIFSSKTSGNSKFWFHRAKMEAPRPVGGRIQRKPLADCTNVVSRSSSQQQSSTIKYANPSLTSSLKRLVDQTTLKEKPKDVNASEAASENASPSPATNVRPVTRRMSADLSSPASAPSRPQNLISNLGNWFNCDHFDRIWLYCIDFLKNFNWIEFVRNSRVLFFGFGVFRN